METKKIFMHDKTISICMAVLIVAFFLIAITLIICGIINLNLLIVGCILLAISVILFFTVVFGKSILNFVILSEKEIKLSTIFGTVIKHKRWTDLQQVVISTLVKVRPTSRFICLVFAEKQIDTNFFDELMQNKNIILLAYSEKNLDIIRAFTGTQGDEHKGTTDCGKSL